MIFVLLSACTAPIEETVEPAVEDEMIIGILVTPEQSILSVGQTLQLKATALTSLHNSLDVTESVKWMVEYYDIIEISDDLDSEGKLTALSEGRSRIYAVYDDIQSPYVDIVVTEASLLSIQIAPENIVCLEGQQLQMKATGYFSDGNEGDITQQVRWLTENANVVQFRENGVLFANGIGTTTIQAKKDRLNSAPSNVLVNPYVENGRADLVFESVELQWYGDTTLLYAILVNQGAIGAEDFWVDLYYQAEAPERNAIGDLFQQISYLGPNQGIGLSFEIDYWNTSTLWLFADSTDSIPESHENNNLTNFHY